MFIEIMIVILLGVLAGTFSGLIPGIHINLISALLISSSVVLLGITSPIVLACFIISMSITHTFLDPIPSVFLGAPDSSTALGVLPGHRYLLLGKGYTAVKLTIIGSLFGLVFAIMLIPFLIPLVGFIYPFLQDFIGYILLAIVLFMILREKKKSWAILVFLSAGLLGFVVFGLANLKNPLFPLLSGLFGVSTLLYSLKENTSIPKQKTKQTLHMDKKVVSKAILSGTFSGWITSVLPGIGAATAAIISLQLTKKLGDYGFMILLGAISTVNFALSLVTLFVLEKARNGSVIAVQSLVEGITLNHIIIFVSVSLIAALFATHLGLWLSKKFSILMEKIPYRKTILGVIGLLTILTFILSGFLGEIILLTATAIGLIPAIVKTSRTHAMGCLLLPVLLYFI